MADTPAGFIPEDQFQANTQSAGMPQGFIPEDQFESQEDTFGTAGQQVLAGLEGAFRGVAGPIATAAEVAAGVPKENILARQKVHPVTAGGSEALGLGASMLVPGFGEAGLMTKAGELAAHAAGLADVAKEAPLIQRVGSSAVQQAAEMAVLAGSDETSKLILSDPEASAESAIANVGMAAILGGAGGAFMTGAISPIWKATVGDKAEQFLGSLVSRLGGVEGAESDAAALTQKTGLAIPPELAAKVDNLPGSSEAFSKLSQTDTTAAGKSLQKTLKKFNSDINDKLLEAVGHEPGYTNNLPELDKYSTGQKLSETLHEDLKEEIKPITDEYDKITEKFQNSPITGANIKQTADSIVQQSIDKGWGKAASDSQTNLMNSVLTKLPEQETALDLKKFITNLRNSNPFGTETYAAARDIAKSISEAQGRAVSEGIIAKGGLQGDAATSLANYRDLQSKYHGLMNKLEALNEHLHVGRYDGPQTFLNAVKETGSISGEAVLNRLSGTNKAQVLQVLSEISPKTLAEVRQFHVNKLLSSSLDKIGELSPNKFITNFNKLTPQIKDLIADEAGRTKIDALGDLVNKLKDDTHNWSNTARTIDKLTTNSYTPLAMLSALFGHAGIGLLTHLGGIGFTEGKDALKLGMLKLLGSNQPLKSEGFKAMVNFFHNTYKGTNLLSKATSNILKSGAQVLASNEMPNKADTEKLDKIVTDLQKTPNKIYSMNTSSLGHYLPNHQTALTEASTRALTYLQTLKPQDHQNHPLDKPIPPTEAEKARYQRALQIAQQPAIVLKHVKDGTIQTSDIKDLGAMYPGLYKQISAKLSDELVNKHSDEEPIPYKTKMGISLFLGQALDSSMIPSSIQAAQATYIRPGSQNQPQNQSKTKKGTSTLGKSNNSYKTPLQASEEQDTHRK